MSSSRLKEIEDSQEDMSVLEKSPQMSPTSTPDTRAEEKKGLSFDLETRLRSVLQQYVSSPFVAFLFNQPNRENTNATRRELGVLFEGLRVVGVGGAESYQMTFSSYFNPKIWLEKVRNARYPQVRDIISSFDGLVRPGEMLRAFKLISKHFISLTSVQLFWAVQDLVALRFSRHWPTAVTNFMPPWEKCSTTLSLPKRSQSIIEAISNIALRTTSISQRSRSKIPSVLPSGQGHPMFALTTSHANSTSIRSPMSC